MARSSQHPWRPASPPREHPSSPCWVSLGAVRAQDTSERGMKGKERDWDRVSLRDRWESVCAGAEWEKVGSNLLVTLGPTAYCRARPLPPLSDRIFRPSSTLGPTRTVQHAQGRVCRARTAARFALARRTGTLACYIMSSTSTLWQVGGVGCSRRMGETRPFTGPRDTLCRHDHPLNGAYRRLTPTRPNLVY